ncbi:MAG: GAF domain-containing protein, partial [Micrococcaceae bacterium]|nr:GAF domain-containing protein [Micrococcaceae bacterium]
MPPTQEIAPQGFAVERVRENFIDSRGLFDARSRGIRGDIADSWKRSLSLEVDPDSLAVREAAPQGTDDNLLRCVDRVLMRAAEQLSNEPVSILFATPCGGVARRYCTDASLVRRLDSVNLAPGSGYDEETVGTNGIGTALESTRPTVVHAFEHFNEELAIFACAGAPVVHPVTGSLLGVVDLTCKAHQLNNLLLTLASSLADQIAQLVFAEYGGDLHLMREYLSACRHASGPVIAHGGEVVMMNRHSRQMLTPEDRTALLIHSAECAEADTDHSAVADLPSGITARLESTASIWSGRVVGDIVRVRLGSNTLTATVAAGRSRTLPGLVGSAP